MNLGKNVYNLLKRQSEVYIQGLGSFRRNYTPATYDERRNVYLPPITYIEFDRTSTKGYDFIQYIQQLQQVDKKEAESEVAKYVAELLSRVSEEGQVKLDGLGHLISYGENYVFKAVDLSDFQYEAVQVVDRLTSPTPEIPVEKEEPQPIAEESIAEETSTEENTPEEEEQVEEAENPRRSNMVWYVIAALTVLGIVVALYLANRNKQAIVQTAETAENMTDSTKIEPDKTQVESDTAAVTDSLKPASVDTAQRQATLESPLVPAHHQWQIVIGSHKTLAQAYEQAESFNKAGYEHVRVIPSNLAKNRKKVIWDSYETKKEVDSALRYVQRHIIPDAWPDHIK